MTQPSRQDDLKHLRWLDLRDHEGMSMDEIADEWGVGKGAVIGALSRIRRSEQPCLCKKPENKDGGQPRGWWK